MTVLQDTETVSTKPDVDLTNLAIAQLRGEVKDLRNQLAGLHAYIKNNSFKGLVRRSLAYILCMRLHMFEQYAPCDLYIPKKYYKPIPLPNPPLISIVTPSFNQGHFIEQTIRSVLDQNYPKLEYAVQDGGSRDNTNAVVDRYRNRLVHAESRKDKGQGNAINLGFEHASGGEIMAYLNSDDLLLPGALNYVAAYFAAHPEVDVVYGHRAIINANGEEIGRWVLPTHSDRMLIWADYVPQETLFWRRSIWEKAGGMMDESFQFALDWDLLLRFRAAGAKFVRLPRFLGAFRVHQSQKTSDDLASTGIPEMKKLKMRLHGRETTLRDLRRNMNGYMLRHGLHNFLYKIGLSAA